GSPTTIANTVDCHRWFVISAIIGVTRPFPFLFHLELLNGLLQLANVIKSELARFGQLRHHRLGSPSKETQNFFEQPVPRRVPRQDRFKNMCVADLSHAAHDFLSL